MTPREFALARQGTIDERRDAMGHTALIVSALTGKEYTAAMLLGEEDDTVATREAEAEIAAAELMRQMKEAGL